MNMHVDEKAAEERAVNPWYQAAVRSAIVGGAFSVIVLGLLILNQLQIKLLDPMREERLEAIKLKVFEGAVDEQVVTEIRELDLQIRENKIRRLRFSHDGNVLLLGGVAVFLVSVKLANAFKKRVPSPELLGDSRARQLRQAMRARWSVTLFLVLLGSGAIFLVSRKGINFTEGGTAVVSYPSADEISKNWLRFRGPGGSGVSAYTNVPSKWSEKDGTGILWKSRVPLSGNNSPVVWGERVFVSGADENNRQVYCFDGLSGKLLWTGEVTGVRRGNEEEAEPMEETGFASPTVATDGRRVYAIFASGDIGCFDFDGKKVWEKNLGVPDNAYGYASSLAMYRNLVLIQYDQGGDSEGKSKLIALDGFSGRTMWETKRPVSNSWTSPIVVKIGDEYNIITCGEPWVIAYEASNGMERWRADCLGGDLAPSPIYAGGYVLAVEPYNKLVAIRPDGRGDVTKTHIAWRAEDNIPDICSPVSDGELVFLLTTEGTLTCYKIEDGSKVWEKELDMNFQASPSLVGNRLYMLSEDGVMLIAEAGVEFKQAAICEIDEGCVASPAFASGRIYIRAKESLYCIGNQN
ncbi:MAG: outer membrane protein assembly factor BamB family protein [Planctomycetota bacterium]|jgi:outer membrane protein assembly factor BamB